MRKETIAAIATAMSDSGIGIIRISGPEAFLIADRVFKRKKQKPLSEEKANTVHYGFICDRRGEIRRGSGANHERTSQLYSGRHSGDRLSWWCSDDEKNPGDCDPIWSKTSRAGRIYETGVFKWADRSVPGRSGHRCDQRPE